MIAILVFPDFQLLDAAGPISVFEHAMRIARVPAPIKIVSATPGEVRSSSGVSLVARSLKAAAGAHTLLIAGGIGVDAAIRSKSTLSFIRAAARLPCRQCLLGCVSVGGSGVAGRPPRDDALAAHRPFPDALSECETGAGPDFRARW